MLWTGLVGNIAAEARVTGTVDLVLPLVRAPWAQIVRYLTTLRRALQVGHKPRRFIFVPDIDELNRFTDPALPHVVRFRKTMLYCLGQEETVSIDPLPAKTRCILDSAGASLLTNDGRRPRLFDEGPQVTGLVK
jgi:hypothetical protein